MTVEDDAGITHAWVEVFLDDKWYTVDASKEIDQIMEFAPEATDVEGAIAEPTEDEMPDTEAEGEDAVSEEAGAEE